MIGFSFLNGINFDCLVLILIQDEYPIIGNATPSIIVAVNIFYNGKL